MRLTETEFACFVRQTIAWSVPRIDTGNSPRCLRSPALRPPVDYDDNEHGLINAPEYIQHVIMRRSRLLAFHQIDISRSSAHGDLLIVDYDATNVNGLTEEESDRFLDDADNPPWDLWVCGFEDKLICWIPELFVSKVVRAMRVDHFDVLHWVTPETAKAGVHPEWMLKYTSRIE